MDGDGPRQPQRELHIGAHLLLLDFLLGLVEAVAHILPHVPLNVIFVAVLGHNAHDATLGIDSRHHTKGAVDPPVRHVVLDEHHVAAWFQFQLEGRGHRTLGELPFHLSHRDERIALELVELPLVDVVDRIAACRQRNGQSAVSLIVLPHPLIETAEVSVGGVVRPDIIENGDESGVRLAVDLLQLDAHELKRPEDMSVEEVSTGVERMEERPVVLAQDGLKLIDIADEEHLLSAERLPHVAAVDAQHLVDEVDNVGPHHAHLVDDDELHLTDELYLLTVVFQHVAQMAHRIARVGGQQRMERQLEERVERRPSGVDGRDARRREDDVLLLCRRCDISEERRLSRTRLSGEEEAVTGELHYLQSVLQLRVRQVDILLCVHRRLFPVVRYVGKREVRRRAPPSPY